MIVSADVVVTNVRVVGDFYHRIGARIGSLLLRNDRAEPLRLIRFELATDDVPAALELLRQTWRRAAPDLPFQYTFFDDEISDFHRAGAPVVQFLTFCAAFFVFVAGRAPPHQRNRRARSWALR